MKFQGFIQIGVGVGIAIDYLTTSTRDGIARVFLERQGEFPIFMKFHVFHGSIPIGIGIAIAIGIDTGADGSESGAAGGSAVSPQTAAAEKNQKDRSGGRSGSGLSERGT